MCEISKSPPYLLVPKCSSIIPGLYETGISQPANSTIWPPCSRCHALSGVFFSSRSIPLPSSSLLKLFFRDLSVQGCPKPGPSSNSRLTYSKDISGTLQVAQDFPGRRQIPMLPRHNIPVVRLPSPFEKQFYKRLSHLRQPLN